MDCINVSRIIIHVILDTKSTKSKNVKKKSRQTPPYNDKLRMHLIVILKSIFNIFST